FNGEPVVALGIKRSKGASDVVVAGLVQKRIDALKVAYPDVDLKLIDTSVEFTKGNYEAAISTLFEGAFLAVVIVLLFLRDLCARKLHVGDRRAILQAVRHHGFGAGVLLAIGRALRHAGSGRLFPERSLP